MPGVSFLNVLDVGRAFGNDPFAATPATIAAWLREHYLVSRKGGFNYDPATTATIDMFRGCASAASAQVYCLTHGNPKGRKQNASAVAAVSRYALTHPSACHRIGFTAVAVGRSRGRTIYIGIKAPIVRVEHRKAYWVMPGFRMTYRPGEREIDVACSIAKTALAKDDYAKADLEYLYAGPGAAGAREFRAILGRERSLFDGDTVDALLDTYVQGVALVVEDDARLAGHPKLAGYRVIDPQSPSFL